jgi:hypothetical protein
MKNTPCIGQPERIRSRAAADIDDGGRHRRRAAQDQRPRAQRFEKKRALLETVLFGILLVEVRDRRIEFGRGSRGFPATRRVERVLYAGCIWKILLEVQMIDLYNASTNQLIGSITEGDLKVIQDGLEEESTQDQDYYIDAATIDMLGDGRATEHLLGLLRTALGSSEGVDIRWQRR